MNESSDIDAGMQPSLDDVRDAFETQRERIERLARLALRTLDLPAAAVAVTGDGEAEPVVTVGAPDVAEQQRREICRRIAENDGIEILEMDDLEGVSADARGRGFCAGMPLSLPSGPTLGVLCLFGERLDTWDSERAAALEEIGRSMVEVVERQLISEQLQRTNEALSAILEASPVAIMTVDREGKVARWNPEAARIFGYSAEEIQGERVPVVPPEKHPEFVEALETIFGGERIDKREIVRETNSGERRVFLLSAAPVYDADGSVREAMGTLEEITDRKRRERAVAKSEERFRRIFEEAGIGIALVGLDGSVQKANAALHELLGYEPGELVGLEFVEFTHPDDVDKDVELFDELVDRQRDRYQIEKRFVTSSEEIRWGRLTASAVTDPGDEAIYVLAMVEDITAQKEAERELVFRAQHDALTGLVNRETFEQRLSRRMTEAGQNDDHSYAVLFLDLDGLKEVNDRLGHGAGDELLVEVSDRLETLLRSGDSVARVGGDEFAVLLEYVGGREEAVYVAERLRTGLAAPTAIEGEVVYPSASVGIAAGGPNYETPDEILRDADSAMYRAKDEGGGRLAVSDDPTEGRADQTRELGRQVRRALDRDELQLQYRPLTELADGEIVGAIVAPLWDHPEHGPIGAERLRRAVQNAGAHSEFDHWLIDGACRQAETWRSEYGADRVPRLHVPCRNEYCDRDTFVETLVDGSDHLPVADGAVTVGLPERRLVGERSGETAIVEAYREVGLGVGLDDFGDGPMSLRLLERVEFDAVVLDADLLDRLPPQGDDSGLVRAACVAAANLDQTLVADGVETESQLDWLRQTQCSWAAGPAVSGPVDRESFAGLFASDG